MIRYKRLIFTGLIFIFSNHAWVMGQSTYSTYSILGVGDYVDSAVPAAMGMAGLGISNGSHWYLNNSNPALLYYNNFALFSAGILAETKNITQIGYEPYSAGSGNLNHIAMAFPIRSGKWSMSLGLQPYSSVNYAFIYDALPEDSPAEADALILNEGSGGITSLSFSVGGVLYKGLSVGLKGSYLFSSYEKTYSSITNANIPSYIASYLQRQSVSDFTLGLGIAYKVELGKYQLGLGAIYDLQADVKGEQFVRVEQRMLNNTVIFSDTLANDTKNTLSLPATLGGGISFGVPNRWLIGFDYKTQDWSSLTVDPTASPDKFTRGNKYIIGGEFTADPLDIKNYLKRVTFRLGATYEEKPYWLSNTQIKEFGINFGWTLPVSRFSSLDFGMMVGTRGTTDNNLVKEDFFKVYFGATFNDNRWFLRPKFN